jgi:lipoate-protein ligase B
MQFWSLRGIVPYEKIRQLQLDLVELRSQDRIPDTVLFLEHEPVITRGRGLQFTGTPRPRHMPVPQHLPEGISFSESERGGDLTYHGPGQLVVYPVCKLDGRGFGPAHDVAGFLRKIEKILIDDLAERGLKAEVKDHATGVWIGSQKIASIGIAVKKWVTYHGAAINCVNDLRPFHFISPCGFHPEVMTRLSDWTELDQSWRSDLEKSIARKMTAQLVSPSAHSVVLQLSTEEIQTALDPSESPWVAQAAE